MMNKYIIMAAQAVSLLFTPWYLALLGFVLLLIFSYLNMLPWQLKLMMGLMVYLFTVLLPYWSIYIYRRANGLTSRQMGQRERRLVPYAISILCYTALWWLMRFFNLPSFTQAVVAGALFIQILCAVVNMWVKVSTHAAAIGGIIGALMAFSLVFSFDPTGWLCLSILVAGVVCTARMILRQHTLGELGLGLLIGLLCGWGSVLML
ncbi:MAG: hypothetical protein MJZ43_02355 [Bacteroidaceae bacterium]|nr:hypothetical protein [Candidatus Equimonas faecalis]MCQ2205603.1 hypothetical protein [Bacteroidaceae bacterium]